MTTRPDRVQGSLVALRDPTSFEAEQYRALRHLLEQTHKSGAVSIIAISSPGPGDGKTVSAINLAASLAEAPEARVLLVDADLRRSSVTAYLGLGDSRGPGLVDAVTDSGLALADVVRRLPAFKFALLPSGRNLALPYDVLNAPRLGELLEEARQQYDYVVLDTPPVVPVPDCRVIARWVDGFVIVVAAHKTSRKLLEDTLNLMDPDKVIGLVFNQDDRPLSEYGGYYYASASARRRRMPRWAWAAKVFCRAEPGSGSFAPGPRSAPGERVSE